MERKVFLGLLGRRIVELRQKIGISQAELARRCEKDPQSIERIENAKVNPTAHTLYQIAKALDCKTMDLFDFEH